MKTIKLTRIITINKGFRMFQILEVQEIGEVGGFKILYV